MAIMGAALGLAIPTMKYTDMLRLEYEANLLARRLEYVKEISGESDPFTVPGYREYAATPCFSVKVGGGGYLYTVRHKIKESWELPKNFYLISNREETYFYNVGEATTCTYTLYLKNKSRNVIVDRVGRIRIE